MASAERPAAEIPDDHVGILETAMFAMLSTISHRDGLISTNPVAFDWDGKYIRVSTLKSRVKYRNLLANAQVTFCALDAKMPTQYVEVRGYAEVTDDPGGELNRKMFRRMTGTDFPPELDEPGDERVIVKIIPTKVSGPTIYGGQVDHHVHSRKSGKPQS